jgi:amino acid transporter
MTWIGAIKRLVIGEPLATALEHEQRLTKKLALAVFSSDALSSSAYATEELLKALFPIIAFGAFSYVTGISFLIIALLVIVAISYWQTIHAYPQGGGAYTVARENLGEIPGLFAAAALFTDYVLTVAVSVAAGIEAIVSAVPALHDHKVRLGALAILAISMANLRGVKESGRLFAIPTYVFIASLGGLILIGARKLATLPAGALPAGLPGLDQVPAPWLTMAAFSSGCAALTGIEAISNGVRAFREPAARDAAVTLAWMAAILAILFGGVSILAAALPRLVESREAMEAMMRTVVVEQRETLISAVGRVLVGSGSWFYYLVQVSTMMILLLAANTSFAGFPRLASILARDGYAPRQLSNLGERLVFSNGIVMLATLAILLVWALEGSTHALIPLYAVGVFISFTLSQTGMVRYWIRHPDGAKPGHALLNLVGAAATGVVLCIIASTKFMHGAWVVVALIPVQVLGFLAIQRHYAAVKRQLALPPGPSVLVQSQAHVVLVPLANLHRGVLDALAYARTISGDVRAVTVEAPDGPVSHIKEAWSGFFPDVPLVVLESPYRSLVQPLLDYVREIRAKQPGAYVTVVVCEFIVARWWQTVLHNQSALLLSAVLRGERGVVVTSVRMHLEE